tara:strand:+ start:1548 stop:2075 length:528 start_codon:yes stop_codon:yes gene_type:complete
MVYPEDLEKEEQSIIKLASPVRLDNEMPYPNYKIGPVTPHTKEKGPLQSVAEQAGASVVGKAGEAALFGVPAAEGVAATPGMWSSMAPALASNPIGWAIGLGMLGKGLGWFNKGGAVHANMGGLLSMDMGKLKGPLASMLLPQYKEHGGMTSSSGPLSNNKSVKMEKKETIEYKN